MRSHLPAVDVILELGGPKLLLAQDILGCTPVHLAAVQNQVRMCLQQPLKEQTHALSTTPKQSDIIK